MSFDIGGFLYLKFELEEIPQIAQEKYPNISKVYLLVWTTTPWTLVSNLALAVNKKTDYTLVSKGNEGYIIAKDLLDKLKKEIT